MESLYRSLDERKWLERRKALLKKLVASELYTTNANERKHVRQLLGLASDSEKAKKSSVFIKKYLQFSENDNHGDQPLDSPRPLLPRIFNEFDDASISGMGKKMDSREIIAFLRTISTFKQYFLPEISLKSQAIRHVVLGKVSHFQCKSEFHPFISTQIACLATTPGILSTHDEIEAPF